MMQYARYTAATLFASLAMAFIALWVRSYWYYDVLVADSGEIHIAIDAHQGSTVCYVAARNMPTTWPTFAHSPSLSYSPPQPDGGWAGFSYQIWPSYPTSDPANGLPMHASWTRYACGLLVPHWFLALSSLALAALLAFKPITRFTIRRLLITTTLLAAVLGLAVYAL
jgi:hypothetical protein